MRHTVKLGDRLLSVLLCAALLLSLFPGILPSASATSVSANNLSVDSEGNLTGSLTLASVTAGEQVMIAIVSAFQYTTTDGLAITTTDASKLDTPTSISSNMWSQWDNLTGVCTGLTLPFMVYTWTNGTAGQDSVAIQASDFANKHTEVANSKCVEKLTASVVTAGLETAGVTTSVSESEYSYMVIISTSQSLHQQCSGTFTLPTVKTYTVTLNGAAGGTISAGDTSVTGVNDTAAVTVTEGESITLTATPETGYKFSLWNIDGDHATSGVPTQSPLTITPTGDCTVTAIFTEQSNPNLMATPTELKSDFDGDVANPSAFAVELTNIGEKIANLGTITDSLGWIADGYIEVETTRQIIYGCDTNDNTLNLTVTLTEDLTGGLDASAATIITVPYSNDSYTYTSAILITLSVTNSGLDITASIDKGANFSLEEDYDSVDPQEVIITFEANVDEFTVAYLEEGTSDEVGATAMTSVTVGAWNDSDEPQISDFKTETWPSATTDGESNALDLSDGYKYTLPITVPVGLTSGTYAVTLNVAFYSDVLCDSFVCPIPVSITVTKTNDANLTATSATWADLEPNAASYDPRSVTIVNTGGTDAYLTSMPNETDHFSISGWPDGDTIAAGANVTLTVTPKAANITTAGTTYTDTLTISYKNSGEQDDSNVKTATVTLTATTRAATPATLTVTYDKNLGGIADNISNWPSVTTVTQGSAVSEPTPAPSMAGYIFGGWYTTANCSTEYDFATVPTGDVTLYAKWLTQVSLENTIGSLTYAAKDLTSAATNLITVKTNTDSTALTSGYSVTWYSDSEKQTPVTEIKNAGIYYATVTLTDSQYAFEGGATTADFTLTVNKAKVTATIYPISGKVGENNNPTITVPGVSGNLIQDTDYTVTWDSNGEPSTSSTAGTYTATIALQSAAATNYELSSSTLTYTVTAPDTYTATVTVKVGDAAPKDTDSITIVLRLTGDATGESITLSDPTKGEGEWTYNATNLPWGNSYDIQVNGHSAGLTVSSGAETRTVTLYRVTIADPLSGGSATVQGNGAASTSVVALPGTQLALSASANTNYKFAGWSATAGTITSGTSASTTYTVGGDNATLTPSFTALPAFTLPKQTVTTVRQGGYGTGLDLMGGNGFVTNSGAGPTSNSALEVKITSDATGITPSNDFNVEWAADATTSNLGVGATARLIVTPANAEWTVGTTHTGYLWVIDGGSTDANDNSISAKQEITVTVLDAQSITVTPSEITWDTFAKKVTSQSNSAVATLTVDCLQEEDGAALFTNIQKVELNGNLVDSQNYTVTGPSKDGETYKATIVLSADYLQSLTEANNGQKFRITALNKYSISSTADVTLTVTNSMPTLQSVTLTPTSNIRVGDTVSVASVTATSSDAVDNSDWDGVTFAWYLDGVSGTPITDQTGSTITVTKDMENHLLFVVVTGDNINYKSSPIVSAYVGPIKAQQFTVIAGTCVDDAPYSVGDITTTPAAPGAAGTTAEGVTVSTNTSVVGYKFENWTQDQSGGTAGSFDDDAAASTTFHPKTTTTVTANYITIPVLEWAAGSYTSSGTEGSLGNTVAFAGTVTNKGKADATGATYTLDGTSDGTFTLTVNDSATTAAPSLAVDGKAVIKITPATDLTRGTYTANLVITYTQDGVEQTEKIPFTFTVDAPKWAVSIDEVEPAGFAENITAGFGTATTGYTFGTSEITDGELLTLKAVLADNYIFGGWTIVDGTGTGEFGAADSLTSTFKPGSNVTIKATAVAQPNVTLTDGSTGLTQTVRKDLLTADYAVYTGALTNDGAAEATNVTYTLTDKSNGDAESDSFAFQIKESSSLSDTLAKGDTQTIKIIPEDINRLTEGTTYTMYLFVNYQHKDADGEDVEATPIVRTVTFTVGYAQYTVTLDAPTGLTVSAVDSDGNKPIGQGTLESGYNITRPNFLTLTAKETTGYEFAGWSVTSGNGTFGAANSKTTTFTPDSDVTIRAAATPVAVLVLSDESKNHTVDLTALDATTEAYTATLTNQGAANATGITYKVYEANASGEFTGAESQNFKMVDAASSLTAPSGGTGTETSLKIVPSDPSALTEGKYLLKLVIEYNKTDAAAGTTIEVDNIVLNVTKEHFDAQVRVKIDGTLVGVDAKVELAPVSPVANYETVEMTKPTDLSSDTTNFYSVGSTDLTSQSAYNIKVTLADGKTIDAGQVSAASPTATVELYTVTLAAKDNNDALVSAALTGAGTYLKGSFVNVSTTVPSGYDFVNWTGADTTSSDTATSYTISSIESAVSLTANFKPYYYLAYNLNGAPGTPTATKKYYLNDDVDDTPANVTWTGREFKGWYTAADTNSGAEIEITNETDNKTFGAVFANHIPNSAGGAVTLYAIWKAYAVTYPGGLGDGNEKNELSAEYGQEGFSIDLGNAYSSDHADDDDKDDSYITYSLASSSADVFDNTGLTLSPDGTLKGRPQAVGTYEFTVVATDSRNGESAEYAWKLTVNKYTPQFSSAEVIPGQNSVAVNDATLMATLTAPYYNATTGAWEIYKDSVVRKVNGDGNIAGDGALTISPIRDFTSTAENYTLTYTPADDKENIYAESITVLPVSSSGSTTVEVPNLVISPTMFTFKTDAAETASGQKFTVTNNGGMTAGTLTYAFGKGDGSYFEFVGTPDTNDKLEAGESVTFTVRPKTGLGVGTYFDTVTVTSASGKYVTAFLVYDNSRDSFDFTVNTQKVTVNGETENAEVTSVAMRPVGGEGDIAGLCNTTDKSEWTWKSTNENANALAYNGVYEIVVNDFATGIYVKNDTVDNENGHAATVTLYELALAHDPGSLIGDFTLAPAGGFYLPGQQVTLTAPSEDGYRFINWTKPGDNAGEPVAVGTAASFTYTMPEAATTLTAHYEAKYGVEFAKNDGTDAKVTVTGVWDDFIAGETVTVPASTDQYGMTRTGFTFIGWAAENTATTGSYTFAVDNLVSAQSHSGNKLTLYAVWKANPLSASGGTLTGTFGTALPDGDDAPKVTPPTGGSGSYIYAEVIQTGAESVIPAGITLGSDGAFSGTPSAATATEVTVPIKITDTVTGATTTVDYTINIAKADPTVTSLGDKSGKVGDTLNVSALTEGATVTGTDNTTSLSGSWTIENGTDADKVTVTEGSQSVTLVFTPNDINNYNTVEKTITVTGTYNLITQLNLTGLGKPTGGSALDADAGYSDVYLNGEASSEGNSAASAAIGNVTVAWTPAGDGNGYAVAGQDYTATVTITPAANWKFDTADSSDERWTAENITGTVTHVVTADLLVYQIFFAADAKITSVAVNTSLPVAGGYTTTVAPADATYKIDKIEWTDSSTNTTVTSESGKSFAAGGSYTIAVTLIPSSSRYTFDTTALAVTADSTGAAKVNNDNAKITEVREDSITIQYGPFEVKAEQVVGLNVTGNVTTTVYYVETDTHTTAAATGHKTDVTFAWSNANNIAYKLYYGNGQSDASAKTLVLDDNSGFTLVYGADPTSAKDHEMPADGTKFTKKSSGNDDVEKYDGKNVYVQYTEGSQSFVAPEPVGTLVVRELEATGIEATAKTATLSYKEGEKFVPGTATATVDFNTDATALNVTDVAVPDLNTTNTPNATKFYYAYKDTSDYTVLPGGTSMTVSDHNGKELYICYTDVNGHTVRSYVGALSVAGETDATVTIKKGANEVNDSTNPAEYGDVLTADVTGDVTGTLKYTWEYESASGTWTPVPNASGPTIVVPAAVVGKDIKVTVTEAGKIGSATDNEHVYPRTIKFTVAVVNKPYDTTADNNHIYAVDDFTLSNVVNGDDVTLKLAENFTLPKYQTGGADSAVVGSTITWPAVTAESTGYTISGDDAGNYRLGEQGAQTGRGEIVKAAATVALTTGKKVEPGQTPAGIDDIKPADGNTTFTLTTDSNITWKYYDGTNWVAVGEGTGLKNGNFLTGTRYQLVVPVTAAENYVLVNGSIGTLAIGSDVYTGTVTTTDNAGTATTGAFIVNFPTTSSGDANASTATVAVRNTTKPNKDTEYGDTLEAVVSGTTNTDTDLTYQWQRWNGTDWENISGAENSTYTIGKDEVGKFIRVRLTADGSKTMPDGGVYSDAATGFVDADKDSNDHIYADKRDLTVTWNWIPGSKTYDGTNTADAGDNGENFKYEVEGEAGNDTVTLENVTAATFDNADVGSGKTITITGGGLKSENQACYNLKTVNAPKGDITALQLEWDDFTFIEKQDKTYDGTKTVADHISAGDVTWSAAGNNKITGTPPAITVTYAYTSKDALGTGASSIEAKLATKDTNVILPAGSHYIDGCTIRPYDLTVGPGDLTDKGAITTTVGTPSKTMAGAKSGVKVDSSTETVNFTIQAVFADASKAADSVKVTYSGLSWTDRNYDLTWSGSDTTGSVTEANITGVAAKGTTEIYGTPYSDVKFNVEVTFDGGAKTTFNSLSDLTNLGLTVRVGNNSVIGTDTVAWSDNGLSYEVSGTGIAATTGTITVSPRPLTVTGASWNLTDGKYYDGNTNVTTADLWDVASKAKNTTGAITLTFGGGIMSGDTPTAAYTYTAALDNENVSDHHTISISDIDLTGANEDRYTLADTTFALRDQKIVARPVTVQFTTPSVVKDSPVNVTLTGVLVESDGTTALATGENVPVTARGTYASTATVGNNITVTVADLTVSNPNYNVTKVESITGSVTEKQITSVTVTYTAPAKGGKAAGHVGYTDSNEVKVPTTAWYNVTDKKDMNIGDAFESGKTYKVSATFEPQTGYAFATDAASGAITTNFSLNGTNYTVSNANVVDNGNGTVTVMAVFTVPADSTTIQHINLALTAPVVDAAKTAAATVSSATTDQGGDAKSGVATGIAVTWAADADGNGTFEVLNGSIDKFLSGYTYQATITGVKADTNWTLADDVDFAVNGVGPVENNGSLTSGGVTVTAAKQSDGSYTITVTFPKQGSRLVESVYINTLLPAEHGRTVPGVYVVSTEPYEATKTENVADLYWEVSDDGSSGWTRVASGDKFVAGKYYRVTGKVQLKSENYIAYDITRNTRFFVGGEEVSQAADGTSTYDVTVDGVTFSARFAATDPDGKTVTANADGVWPDNTVYTLTLTTKTALVSKTDKVIDKIAIDVLQPVALQTLPSVAGTAGMLLVQNAAGESLIGGLEVSAVTWRDVTDNSAVTAVTPGTTISTGHTYEANFTVTADTTNGYSLKADGADFVDFLINGVTDQGGWINGEAANVTDTTGNISVTTAKNGSDNSYTVTVRFTNVGTSVDVLTVWGLAKVPEAKEKILNTDLELKVASTQPYEVVEYDAKTYWNHWNVTDSKWEKTGANDSNSTSDIPTFKAGERYQAVISVQLKNSMSGYAFTTTTAGYINDTEANATTVKYFDSSNQEINPSSRDASVVATIELSREFVVPATEVYVRVASNVPQAGDLATDINNSIKKPDGADDGYTLEGGRWYADQAGTTAVTTFEAGKTYYLIVTAKPNSASYSVPGVINGYYWDDKQCFATKVETVSDGVKATFEYKICATQAPDLTEIPVNVTPPSTNTLLDATGWTSENFYIMDGGVKWYKGSTAEGTPVTGAAAGETVYTAQVTVMPKNTVDIADDAVCKFNNNTLPPANVTVNGDGSYTLTYTFPATQKITTSGGSTSGGGTSGGSTSGGTTVVPGGTVTVTEEVPVVTYWLGDQGVTGDLTAEKVAAGGKPSHVPVVTCIQEGYSFAGWSETDPGRTGDPKLVDPRTFTIDADKTFYAVYKADTPATDKHEHYVKGYDTGVFLPLGNITRAEAAAIIARSCVRGYVEGANYGNAGFSDIEGHWARSAIAFCALSGILNGYPDGTFHPDDPITREQFAVAFAKMAGVRQSGALTFEDTADVSDWAYDAVYTCVANGWVGGYPDGTFRPQQNLLRSEAVKIMNGYLKRGVDKEGLSEVLDLLKIFPDVPEDYWAYFEIIEASNDHEFYYVGEDGAAPPEHWTDAYVGEVSWGS